MDDQYFGKFNRLLPIGVIVIIALVALSSYFIWFVKGLLNTDTSEEKPS